MQELAADLARQILTEAGRYLVVQGDRAYFLDPVFGIVRNRVNAEICKSMLRTGDGRYAERMLNYMLEHQNADGSWNEIHVNYNQPSALITAFIGDALLHAYDRYPHPGALKTARDYVLSCEMRPGYYLKSTRYTADHLNVDASCGAFLAHYGRVFSDEECIAAAERAAKNVCMHQKTGGAYPYAADKGTYPYPFTVPCIHYQGVTMYYLAQVQDVLEEAWIDESLKAGAAWLASAQKPDGRFDWSRSGLMFAYYLTGAYAFAYAAFVYASRWDQAYTAHAGLCLDRLNANRSGIMLRWESGRPDDLPAAVTVTAKTAGIGNFPFRHRAFRFGYGMYRQIARTRYSPAAESEGFALLCRLLNISASTVEPSKNFPDLFMTSEVLDCLTRASAMGEFT